MVGFSPGNGRKGWLLAYWILRPHNGWLFTREWQKRLVLDVLDTSATQWLAFHQGMAEKAGSWHTGYFGHTMVGFSPGNGRKGWLLTYWMLWPHNGWLFTREWQKRLALGILDTSATQWLAFNQGMAEKAGS